MIGTPAAETRRAVAEAAAARQHRPPAGAPARPAVGRPAAALRAGPRHRAASRSCSCSTSRSVNLDAKLRLETRLELHALQRGLGTTTVYVTHDQEEAMTLADRIAVFMEGRIAQVGTPREVFSRPTTMAVAGFIGTPQMNLLPGTWDGNAVTVAGHPLAVAQAAPTSRPVMLGVRPSDLRLAADRPAGPPRARRGSGRQRHRQPARRRPAGEDQDRPPAGAAGRRRGRARLRPRGGAPVRPRERPAPVTAPRSMPRMKR